MEETLNKKLDRLDERLDGIAVLQAIHTEQLKEHMRRSDLLEKRIEQVDRELKPVEEHVVVVNGVFKLAGVLSTLLAIALAIKELF
jgi:hypothetical protein